MAAYTSRRRKNGHAAPPAGTALAIAPAQIVESAYAHASKTLRSQISQSGFVRAWKAVGQAMDAQLSDKRSGVVVPSLGTFTFSAAGQPIFILSDIFSRLSRAQQPKPPAPGRSGSQKVNFMRVSKIAKCPKHIGQAVCDTVVRHCATLVNKKRGAAVRLSLHPVGELNFVDLRVQAVFVSDFLSRLGRVPLSERNLARHTVQTGGSRYGSTSRAASVASSRSRFSGRVAAQADAASLASSTAPSDTGDDSIVERVRAAIIKRAGSSGIAAVSRVLKIMDDSGDKRLSREELRYGLRDYGIDLSAPQVDRIMAAFDRNHDGSISFDEFLQGLRGPMSQRRLDLVHQAFDILDKTGDGVVTIDDLKVAYDTSWHPDVKGGRTTPEKALRAFLDQFDTIDKDGIVTIEEFIEYYKNVSASIDRDDYFELMMRNAWHISGGEGVSANTANQRVMVTDGDGMQRVVEVKDDLGLRRGDRRALRSRLREQGYDDIADVDVLGGVGSEDRNRGDARSSRSRMRNQDFDDRGGRRSRRSGGRPQAARGQRAGGSHHNASSRGSRGGVNSRRGPASPVRDAVWDELRDLLFSPPVPLPALQQKLGMCLAIGTDLMLTSSFASKIKALARGMSRKRARELSLAVEHLGSNRNYIDAQLLHSELLRRFGSRGAKSQSATGGCLPVGRSTNVIQRVRKRILKQGGRRGMHDLMRVVRVMDSDGDHLLSREELKDGLLGMGIEIAMADFDNIMILLDRNRDGVISFAEFVDRVRPPLSETRSTLVERAFDFAQHPGDDGIISSVELERNLDTDDVEMMLEHAAAMGDDKGMVSEAAFWDYYRTESAAIDADAAFEDLMFRHWGPGIEEAAYSSAAERPRSAASSVGSRASIGSRRTARARGRASEPQSSRRRQGGEADDRLAAFRRGRPNANMLRKGAATEALVRVRAAARLQAVFRGHKGREKTDYEQRKRANREARLREAEEDAAKEANRIKRTQPKYNPMTRGRRR